jgi:RND family efflux transporter MFP subunit
MTSLLKPILVLLSFAVCAGASYSVYQYTTLLSETEQPPKARKPQAVEATRIAKQKIADRVELVGTLEADAEANIRPRSAGYIKKLPYDVGDYVEAGEVVVELDQSQAEEAKIQADHALAVRNEELKASNTRFEQLDNTLKRYEELKRKNTITQQQLDDMKAQRDVAEANRDLAQAMVKQAESAQKAARLMKDECLIKTSISGYVAERLAEVGDLAAPVDVLMRIVDLSSVYTVVHVVEKDYDKVRVNQLARVEVDAYPGKVFEGKVERIAPQIDIETRTAAVKIQIENLEGYLKPGMYARVSLQFEEKPDANVIPLATVLEEEGQSYVYIADSADEETTIVRKQAIQLGIIDGERVEVIQGIAPDDLIITLGNRLVKEGDRVEVKRVAEPDEASENYGPPKELEILGAE